jgi:hypothetical protein
MGDFTGFLGGLICKIPVGLDQCYSTGGRGLLGSWAIIFVLGGIALFFLMRNPSR